MVRKRKEGLQSSAFHCFFALAWSLLRLLTNKNVSLSDTREWPSCCNSESAVIIPASCQALAADPSASWFRCPPHSFPLQMVDLEQSWVCPSICKSGILPLCRKAEFNRYLVHVMTVCRAEMMCRHAPFLIAFQERAQVFTTVVEQDRMEQRAMGVRQHHVWGHQHFVTIHRTSLLQV